MAAKIEIKGLSAWYGSKKAILDITMDFAEHDVTAIIGPSGCGKSTLIRCLNRMHETIPKARAEVLLMDEPCSALDPIATAKIEDLIFDLKRQYTVVIVTHNMQQAARVADKTAFLYLGKLIEFNATRDLFERPGQELTEKYITGRFG